MEKKFEQFYIVDDENQELTRLLGEINLYVDAPLSELLNEVLWAIETFFSFCPKKDLQWYETETMTQFRQITNQRAFNLPKTWWGQNKPRKMLRFLSIRDGEMYNSLPTCGFQLWSTEREDYYYESCLNYLRFLFPPEIMITRLNDFIKFVTDLCTFFPLVSGHAGYVIESNIYYKYKTYKVVSPLAMRYHGIDIEDVLRAPRAIEHNFIKGVNWLTVLGETFIERLGGIDVIRSKITNDIGLISTKYGVILRAGEQPELGDVNRKQFLPTYRKVYKIVQPLHEEIMEVYPPFSLDSEDDEEKTKEWHMRFARSYD